MFVYVMSYADREEETTPMFVGVSMQDCYNYVRHYEYKECPEAEIRCDRIDQQDANMPVWCRNAYYLTVTSKKYGVCNYLIKEMVTNLWAYK